MSDNAGAHLSPKKWRDAASSFYSHMFIDAFQADEENDIRRLKEKFVEEQKRICQTMGWQDYNRVYAQNQFYAIFYAIRQLANTP